MNEAKGLSGARVLVTGASAGVGRAFAIGAARRGARVVLAARRQKELDAAAAEAGGSAVAVAADLTEPAGAERLGSVVTQTLGGLDLVVSCVGMAPLRLMMDTGDDHWEQVLSTNLVGTHRLLRACVPLLGRSGTFIALSSDSVLNPRSGLGAYAASKAALEQAITAWRLEHPWLRFTTVALGDTFPTDFGNAFESGSIMRHLDDWAARGLARAQFMSPDDVASTLLSVAATLADLPGIGVEHLTIRSPSPVTASFMDAFAGAGEAAATTDPADSDEAGSPGPAAE